MAPSHPNSQHINAVQQVSTGCIRRSARKCANPLGKMNHLGDLLFLPLNVSTGDKQVLRVKVANWQLSVSSSWKPSQFCSTFISFSVETTIGSEILFSKEEIRGPHNLWISFVSKVFPLSALYLSSSHKAKTPIKYLFVKMFPFGCQGGRDRMQSKTGGAAKASITVLYVKMVIMTKWETPGEDHTACHRPAFSPFCSWAGVKRSEVPRTFPSGSGRRRQQPRT